MARETIVLSDADSRADAALAYVLEVLLGEDGATLTECGAIRYEDEGKLGPSQDGSLTIVRSGFFGARYGADTSIPEPPFSTVLGVPILFGSPRVERRGGTLIVFPDIIASAFFLLTRYEEVVRNTVRDPYGRFPGRKSLAYRGGFLDRPVVDEYGALLRAWLAEQGQTLREPSRLFSVCLTHDIDHLAQHHGIRTVLRAAKGGQIRKAIREAARWFRISFGFERDAFDNIDDVLALDRELWSDEPGIVQPPWFFFQIGSRLDETAGYSVRDRRVRLALERVQSAGGRVGLHASLAAGREPKLLEEEVAILSRAAGKPIVANRHHFLSFREIEDGYALARAGICDDYTLGFADLAGFRLGTCRPFQLYDPLRFRRLGIVEHPLLVMDCSLVWKRYMNLDEEGALRYCERLARACAEHEGEFVILWHNTSLVLEGDSTELRVYRRLLGRLAELVGCRRRDAGWRPSAESTGFGQTKGGGIGTPRHFEVSATPLPAQQEGALGSSTSTGPARLA